MGQPITVNVNLPASPYEVVIAPGLLDGVGSQLRRVSQAPKAIVVTEPGLVDPYARRVSGSLGASGFESITVTLPGGEDHKTLDALLPAFDAALRFRIDRRTPVIALGGGIVGDMAGFLAASLLRGVPLVQVPTTLLAMVDSSVGGKTGINHAVGKNLIGAFHQPTLVVIDPETLRTLPAGEVSSGLAECIKHQAIRDPAGLADLEANISRVLSLEMDYLSRHIAANVAIKARVVESDEKETGPRAHLNFGHTFGHAIETLSHHAYSHGQAVSLGMCAAADLSTRLGMLPASDRDRIIALLSSAGLPTRGLKLDPRAMLEAMTFDKKASGGKTRFVLLEALGRPVVKAGVDDSRVLAALASISA